MQRDSSLYQDSIAGAVSIGIVHRLEVVDIYHQRTATLVALRKPRSNSAASSHFPCKTVPQPGQRVVGGQILHFSLRVHKPVFQFQNARAGAQPGQQLLVVDRLGEIVISSGFEASDGIGLGIFRSEKNDVLIGMSGAFLAQPAAHFGTRHTGHHPVENQQSGSIFGLNGVESVEAIRHRSDGE